jgi:methionine synthase I (cobalamin-dependent)
VWRFDPAANKDGSGRRFSNRLIWMWTLAVLLIVGGCCGAEIAAGKIINEILTDILRMP